MTLLKIAIVCFLFVCLSWADHGTTGFRHTLLEVDDVLAGRVSYDVPNGSRVPVMMDELEGEETHHDEMFLRVTIDPVERKTIKPENRAVETLVFPTVDSTQQGLDKGKNRKPSNATSTSVHYVVKNTEAFAIDTESYVIVNDTSEFEGHSFIQFVVYIASEDGVILSNPLPFIVYIDRPKIAESDEYPTVPAVFAGVLVLFIVFLALVIPFVTRAKRRYKQGKPMFRLGSVATGLDTLDKTNAPSDMVRRESKEPNWYGNNAFSYEDEVAKERRAFTEGLQNMSAQNHPPVLQLKKKPKSNSTVVSDESSTAASTGAASYLSDDDSTLSSRL